MQDDRASWSAEFTAALRADHVLHDDPVVFDDSWALALLSEELREQVVSGGLRRMLGVGLLRRTQGHVVARARVADDVIDGALRAGTRQCVVIGAGLDTTALRRGCELRVFELDPPATQTLKRQRLAALEGREHSCEFAALDLRSEMPAAGLARTSYAWEEPAVILWLGVTFYLSECDTLQALERIRACVAPGSQLVMDYAIAWERLSPELRELASLKSAELARRGEPRLGTFEPRAVVEAAKQRGFRVREHLSSLDLDARCYADRDDDLHANPEHSLLVLEAL
jgi:methyltransferase (TIGR00027 family)